MRKYLTTRTSHYKQENKSNSCMEQSTHEVCPKCSLPGWIKFSCSSPFFLMRFLCLFMIGWRGENADLYYFFHYSFPQYLFCKRKKEKKNNSPTSTYVKISFSFWLIIIWQLTQFLKLPNQRSQTIQLQFQHCSAASSHLSTTCTMLLRWWSQLLRRSNIQWQNLPVHKFIFFPNQIEISVHHASETGDIINIKALKRQVKKKINTLHGRVKKEYIKRKGEGDIRR